jgi:hypothetical protein
MGLRSLEAMTRLHFSDIIRTFRDCMSKDCVPTIVRRIPINQFVNESERCKDSNQHNLLSVCGDIQHIQCSTAFDQPSDPSTISNRRASILE